ARLADEALQVGAAGQLAAARNLDGHDAIQLGVTGLVDRAERPLAQSSDQLELAQLLVPGRLPVRGRLAFHPEARPARGAADLVGRRHFGQLHRALTVVTDDVHDGNRT